MLLLKGDSLMRPRIETQAKALDEPYRVRAMIEFQETGPPRML